jgi:hypothetical protein
MSGLDLNTLNGAQFTSASLLVNGSVNGSGGFSYADGTITQNALGPNGSYHLGGTLGYTYTIHVLSSQYEAPGASGPGSMAVFGTISFSYDLFGTDTPVGGRVTYEIVGFNQGQLLLYAAHQDGSGHYIGPTLADLNANAVVFLESSFPAFPDNFYNNVSAAAAGVTFTPPCFAEGVQVCTVRGEVAVEDLVEGDEVVTASGGVRPVIWIGSRRVKIAAYPWPDEVNPVRVRAGAFGEGAPVRDLRLSPGHAVYVDGVLVPVSRLINGATIVQEAVDAVRYFHIELDAHDVLLAEGLACESYLDDGNREVFANSPEHVALYGRLDPIDWEQACAPVVNTGPRLAAIQSRLHDRAEEMGWVKTAESDLQLMARGTVIEPLRTANGRMWFMIPAGELKLVSNAGKPSELIPGHGDNRRLGVAVSEVRVDGEALDLNSEAFGAGFHPVELDDRMSWRWTDGEANLTLAAPALVEIVVPMIAPSWSRPAAAVLRLVHAS